MTTTEQPQVEVRRSGRRHRTVSAYRKDGKVIVLIPARFSARQEADWVQTMLTRLDTMERRTRRGRSDDDLAVRAARLASAYDLPEPAGVRWVTNQQSRWGSCTPVDRTIRLSHRLQPMPDYVIDYVLVHELAHLVEPSHDARFKALVARYPQVERATGYLEGWSAGQGSDGTGSADPVQLDEGTVDEGS